MSPHTDPGALLKLAEDAFEFIRLKLVDDLDEPQRSAFWKAVEMREKLRQAASHGSAGGELERCAKIADAESDSWIKGEATTAVGQSFQRACRQIALKIRALSRPAPTGGAETVEALAERLCNEYEGEDSAFYEFNERIKQRWRGVAKVALARPVDAGAESNLQENLAGSGSGKAAPTFDAAARETLIARADKYLNTGSGEYASEVMRDMAEFIRRLPKLTAAGERTPFYGAECPSYPNCTGGCGLGCTQEIERARSAAQASRNDIGILLSALRQFEEAVGETFDDEGGDIAAIERDYKASPVPSASRGTEA